MSSGQRGRGFILADQTVLGKGRILAALARAAALDGRRVVFLTEKANLFTDFWRDVRDTNSEAVLGPTLLGNDRSRIVTTDEPGAQALHAAPRTADINRPIRAIRTGWCREEGGQKWVTLGDGSIRKKNTEEH